MTELSLLQRFLGGKRKRELSAPLRAPHTLRRFQSLGGMGRPHVADESLHEAEDFFFVRGEIRHSQHKTRRLRQWQRVHRNTEIVETSIGSNGVFWSD